MSDHDIQREAAHNLKELTTPIWSSENQYPDTKINLLNELDDLSPAQRHAVVKEMIRQETAAKSSDIKNTVLPILKLELHHGLRPEGDMSTNLMRADRLAGSIHNRLMDKVLNDSNKDPHHLQVIANQLAGKANSQLQKPDEHMHKPDLRMRKEFVEQFNNEAADAYGDIDPDFRAQAWMNKHHDICITVKPVRHSD